MASSNAQPTKWANTNTEQQSQKQGQNLETFSLLWLDQHVNESKDNRVTQKQLRGTINCLLTFESGNECEEHIGQSKDEKIVLIVSGRLGKFRFDELKEYLNTTDVKKHGFMSEDCTSVQGLTKGFLAFPAVVYKEHKTSNVHDYSPLYDSDFESETDTNENHSVEDENKKMEQFKLR
ncbi:unnamed protein product [Didymodactylos carnosus]|uniref:Uncharacterized protein n=1 Tax=Didymodactylos carnosus TaxID=1234261 RepID=A0A814PS14_9BILA|nr:unnamed protein product [Didymodactylos carnosus]CAF3874496.1 unnamed protein product [Didymodactylos carnosus]